MALRAATPRHDATNGGGRGRAGGMYLSEQNRDVLLAEQPTCAEPSSRLLASGPAPPSWRHEGEPK